MLEGGYFVISIPTKYWRPWKNSQMSSIESFHASSINSGHFSSRYLLWVYHLIKFSITWWIIPFYHFRSASPNCESWPRNRPGENYRDILQTNWSSSIYGNASTEKSICCSNLFICHRLTCYNVNFYVEYCILKCNLGQWAKKSMVAKCYKKLNLVKFDEGEKMRLDN